MEDFTQTVGNGQARSQVLTLIPRTSSIGNVSGLFMPMFAFDLSTMPGQYLNQIDKMTKTNHRCQSLPMYRLMKSCSPSIPLDSATANYTWQYVPGYQNGPDSSYGDKWSYYWGQEKMDVRPQTFDEVCHKWSEIDMLFACSRAQQCKIHVAVVKFADKVGPKRMYSVDDDAITLANLTSVPANVTTLDDPLTSAEQSDMDVYWENFWDNKVAHPLSRYGIDRRIKGMQILRHETILGNPDNEIVSPNDNYPYMHQKKLFIRGGKWQNLLSNTTGDSTSTTTSTFPGRIGPVVNAAGFGSTGYFNSAYGYNPVTNYYQEHPLYDHKAQARDNNLWLVIWMDTPLPAPNGTVLAETSVYPNFVTNDYANSPQTEVYNCCTFDIRVRLKFEYSLPLNITNTGMLQNNFVGG